MYLNTVIMSKHSSCELGSPAQSAGGSALGHKRGTLDGTRGESPEYVYSRSSALLSAEYV